MFVCVCGRGGRDAEVNEGVSVWRRDLQRCDSLNTEQSSDNAVCLMVENYSLQLRRQPADIFPPLSLGSIIFKATPPALMEPSINRVCNKLIKVWFNHIFDPAPPYKDTMGLNESQRSAFGREDGVE